MAVFFIMLHEYFSVDSSVLEKLSEVLCCQAL